MKKYYALIIMVISLCAEYSLAQLDSIHYLPPMHSRADNQVEDHYVYLSTPETTPFVVTLQDGAGNVLARLLPTDHAVSTMATLWHSRDVQMWQSTMLVVARVMMVVVNVHQPLC